MMYLIVAAVVLFLLFTCMHFKIKRGSPSIPSYIYTAESAALGTGHKEFIIHFFIFLFSFPETKKMFFSSVADVTRFWSKEWKRKNVPNTINNFWRKFMILCGQSYERSGHTLSRSFLSCNILLCSIPLFL